MKKFLFILLSLFILVPMANAKEVEEYIKELSPNGVMKINAIKPSTNKEAAVYLTGYFKDLFINGKINRVIRVREENLDCNQDYSICTIKMEYDGISKELTKEMKLIWEKENSEVKKLIDDYGKKVYSFGERNNYDGIHFYIDDLSLLSFYLGYDLKESSDMLNNFSSESDSQNAILSNIGLKYNRSLEKLKTDEKISYDLIDLYGDGGNQWLLSGGYLVLYYDGIIYGYIGGNDYTDYIDFMIKNVIYIPDDTKDTKEDYIKAATERLNNYLGENKFKLEVVDKREEIYKNPKYANIYIFCQAPFDLLGNESKMGDYFYKLSFGEFEDYFLIIRDSSKIEEELVYENKDFKTDVSVTTTSPEVPLDTVIQVEKIEKGNSLFQKIVKVLKQEVVQIFDISLHSPSVNKNITKLENGDFSVTVPIDEELRGKNLVAYYIDENNKIEEHPMTVDENGTGTFTTNHFSIYTIAEKKIEEVSPEKEDTITSLKGEEVPKTYDGIINYIILGIVSIISLSFITLYIKKHSN